MQQLIRLLLLFIESYFAIFIIIDYKIRYSCYFKSIFPTWVFSFVLARRNFWKKYSQVAGDLWRHDAHVTSLLWASCSPLSSCLVSHLTHWGRATHICVANLTIIASDDGLSPGRHQAIIWTYAGILLNGPLGKNINEISIAIYTFSF